MKGKMTAKQSKFAHGVVAGKTLVEAYISAYGLPGNGRKGASSHASKLAKHPAVVEKIAQLQAQVLAESERAAVASGRLVIEELAKIAFAKGTDFVRVYREEPEGALLIEVLESDILSEQQKAALAGYERVAGGVRVRVHDKMKALELLGKHYGMFSEAGRESAEEKGFAVEIRMVE